MIDTNFDDMAFSAKWRSSLAVYFYIVPDEETADAYPNSRIVYLKLTSSITGWNPSEDLLAAEKVADEARDRRLRFTDDQRRRLAARAKELSRKVLAELATIVTPETLLAWHRKLIANKYDSRAK